MNQVSRLQKLRDSLWVHLPEGWGKVQRGAFLKGFFRRLEQVWYRGEAEMAQCGKENERRASQPDAALKLPSLACSC